MHFTMGVCPDVAAKLRVRAMSAARRRTAAAAAAADQPTNRSTAADGYADTLKKCSLRKRPDRLTARGSAGSSKSTATMPKRCV